MISGKASAPCRRQSDGGAQSLQTLAAKSPPGSLQFQKKGRYWCARVGPGHRALGARIQRISLLVLDRARRQINERLLRANDESDNEATKESRGRTALPRDEQSVARGQTEDSSRKKAAWITTNCSEEGYSETDFWQKSKQFELLHSIFRRRINSITVRSSKGAARFAYFKASE